MSIPLVALGDVVRQADPGFASGKRSPDGILQIRMNCVGTDGGLDLDVAPRVPRIPQLPRFLLEPGDVLFNATNSPELVGKSAFFAGSSEPVTFSNHFLRIRVHADRLESTYLVRWLNSQWKRRVFEAMCTQWVNQAAIRKDRLFRLKLPLPSLAEQRRIAAMLDKADGIRRKRRESLRLLDEFLRSSYARLVGLRNDDYPNWPQLQIADLAATPDSMRTGPFGSSLRHSEFVDCGVAVLGIDNAVQNRFAWAERRFITEKKYEQFKRYKAKPGDVIITIMGTTGRSAVVPDDIPLAISTKHLAVITVDRSRVHPQFLSHAIHADPTILAQISMANRGAIMSGLNLGIIKRLRLRLPPLAVQERFADLAAGVSVARDRLMVAGADADRLIDSLAQRAFQGELWS